MDKWLTYDDHIYKIITIWECYCISHCIKHPINRNAKNCNNTFKTCRVNQLLYRLLTPRCCDQPDAEMAGKLLSGLNQSQGYQPLVIRTMCCVQVYALFAEFIAPSQSSASRLFYQTLNRGGEGHSSLKIFFSGKKRRIDFKLACIFKVCVKRQKRCFHR